MCARSVWLLFCNCSNSLVDGEPTNGIDCSNWQSIVHVKSGTTKRQDASYHFHHHLHYYTSLAAVYCPGLRRLLATYTSLATICQDQAVSHFCLDEQPRNRITGRSTMCCNCIKPNLSKTCSSRSSFDVLPCPCCSSCFCQYSRT